MLKPHALKATTLLAFCFSAHAMDTQQQRYMQRLKEYEKNTSSGNAETNIASLDSLERFMQEVTHVAIKNGNDDPIKLVHKAAQVKKAIEVRLPKLEDPDRRALARRRLF